MINKILDIYKAIFKKKLISNGIVLRGGLILLISVLGLSAGLGFSRDVHLVNAWNGWAPPTLVWASDQSTKIIERDFLEYQNLHIGNSIIMWVYPLAYKVFGMDPTKVQIGMIFVSCVCYALSILFLVRLILPDAPSVIPIFAVALGLLTTAVDGDLARFGQGNFSLGQYYAFAVALQIAVIALAIRGEIVKCAIGLAFLLWIHPMIAAIAGVVAGVALIVPRPLWKAWRQYIAALTLVILSAVLYLYAMRGTIGPSQRMDFSQWIDWVRFANCHWFPFEIGVFTRENTRLVTPLLAILLLVFSCEVPISHAVGLVQKWFASLATCVLLVIIGLINSAAPISMVLTMASLHRASGLLLFLALPFACLALYAAVRDRGLRGILAVVVMTSPFLGGYGFPLLPALALFVSKPSFSISLPRNWARVYGVSGLFVAVLAVADTLWLTWGMDTPVLATSLVGIHTAWIIGGVFGIASFASRLMPQTGFFCRNLPNYILGVGLVVLVFLAITNNWKRNPRIDNRQLAEDYLEVQNWARVKTLPGSLFMTDPSHCYGWKDYSCRPNWGNIRDWIHSSICYHADLRLFNEGLRRARLLKVDPESYMELAKTNGKLTVSGQEYSSLLSKIKKAYYSLNQDTINDLARTEKIDYFVFEKKLGPSFSNKPIFENESFVVYKTN